MSAKEEPTAYEIDVWLDSEPPNPADARDATHFRRIIGARQAADAAQDDCAQPYKRPGKRATRGS